MSKTDRLARLENTALEDRTELAGDLADVRGRAAAWTRGAKGWIAALAGLAAAAGVAFAVARASRKTGGARLKRASRRVRKDLDRLRPRPVAVTLLFALLRTPMLRRAIAAGAARMISPGRDGEEDDPPATARGEMKVATTAPRESRADAKADRDGASPADELKAEAAHAERKEQAHEQAPPPEKGEEKAKETLEDLKRSPFRRKIGFVRDLFRDAFKAFLRDEALTRAAALAYYTILSLAPLLIIVVAVAGLAFGADEVREKILGQIQQLVGRDAAATIATMMQKASKPSSSIPATVIGIATLLLGAGGVFGYLHDMFNKIWGVPPKKGSGLWNAIRARFLSLAMVLGTGFLLLVSLVVSAGLTAIGSRFGDGAGMLFNVLHQIVSWVVIALLFGLIFRFMPDTRIAWRDVWIGAGITSLLFVLGQFLIGLYLGRGSVSSIYGGAGSLLIVLLWTYYSGLILFFGAEVTQVFANRWGSRKKDVPSVSS